MSAKLIITIDTEPDNLWDLRLRKNPEFKNIACLDTLQEVFERFKARPTYLVTYSVAQSHEVAVLKDIASSGNCEIGTHLHAYETPPFDPAEKGDGSYLHQYTPRVQREKIKNIDGIIAEVFTDRPVSYRGGRWSLDDNAISLLIESGYLVDTTILPRISWERDGGMDFKKYSALDIGIKSNGKGDLFEVPATVGIKARFKQAVEAIYLKMPYWTHAEGILRRLAGLEIIWLDPSFNRFEDMVWLGNEILQENGDCLNLFFHSSAIIAGGTPYTMDSQSVQIFFRRLEALLDYFLKERRLEPTTLKEFYAYRKSN